MNPTLSKLQLKVGGSNPDVLKRFMQEFFPFTELVKIGFFKKEMKADYYAQAKRVCDFFGFESIFEYGSKEIKCHITYVKGKRPKDEGFVTTFKNIYD